MGLKRELVSRRLPAYILVSVSSTDRMGLKHIGAVDCYRRGARFSILNGSNGFEALLPAREERGEAGFSILNGSNGFEAETEPVQPPTIVELFQYPQRIEWV